MNKPLRDAIRDQLTDIRSAIRDGEQTPESVRLAFLTYANECIARCFELLTLEELSDRSMHAAIAKVLAK